MAERGPEVAAIITEPVQGAGGVFPPAEGYLEGLRRLCDQHGAYLVFDEVITGFGRLGSLVRRASLRRDPRSGDLRQGGHLWLSTARRRVRRARRHAPRSRATRRSSSATATPTPGIPPPVPPRWPTSTSSSARGCVERAVHMGARLGAGLRSLAADGSSPRPAATGAVWAVAHHPGVDPFAVRDRMLELGVITRAVGTDTNTFCPPLVDDRRPDRPDRRHPRHRHRLTI